MRLRDNLVVASTQAVRHMQKAFFEMNVQLSNVIIAALWAGASWLFFRVARSLRIDLRYARRDRQSGSDRLEKQPPDLRRKIHLFRGTGH